MITGVGVAVGEGGRPASLRVALLNQRGQGHPATRRRGTNGIWTQEHAPDQIRTGDLRLERPTPVPVDRLCEPESAWSSTEGTAKGTEI
jgi:hypothetical protein